MRRPACFPPKQAILGRFFPDLSNSGGSFQYFSNSSKKAGADPREKRAPTVISDVVNWLEQACNIPTAAVSPLVSIMGREAASSVEATGGYSPEALRLKGLYHALCAEGYIRAVIKDYKTGRQWGQTELDKVQENMATRFGVDPKLETAKKNVRKRLLFRLQQTVRCRV